ncbi:MAG: hypothetical protein IPL71_24635 [Anaerolineales bacterium]|uniref:hypothetical protein n=1 Tax=Candidatus Villigracilis proximus TaxID=3140683 RepID=UPI003135F4B9|nr:hypothetical protein [Anaerolineales bacterium]
MKTSDFNTYKTRYRNAIRQVLTQTEAGRLDEAAFPAYSIVTRSSTGFSGSDCAK